MASHGYGGATRFLLLGASLTVILIEILIVILIVILLVILMVILASHGHAVEV